MVRSSHCENEGTGLTSEDQDRLDELVQQYPMLFSGKRPENSHLPAGWFDLVSRACAELQAPPITTEGSLKVAQIKAKFGTLRWYFEGSTVIPAAAVSIIEAAQTQSAGTCMICGAGGHARRMRWIQTLCDEHAE